MRLFLLAPAALGALFLGSACGSTTSPTATRLAAGLDQCFSPDRIINFASEDDAALYVRSLDRKVFHLQTTGGCFNLSSANTIVIRPFTGASRLCTGDTAEITGSAGIGGPQTCRARVVGTLTDEQVAALPSRARP